MSYLYVNKLQLSAWITGPSGEKLREYPFREAHEQTSKKKAGTRKDIKCWITSTEGANFTVNWQAEPIDDSIPIIESKLLDLRCNIWLDGYPMQPGILSAAEIATGGHGDLNGQDTSEGTRLYQFGTLTLTDDDDALQANGFLPNCIELELEWGRSKELDACWVINPFTPPPEDKGPVHERKVKKGNYSSATLGAPSASCEDTIEGVDCEFIPEPKAKSQRFFFYHASAEWLEAHQISTDPPNFKPRLPIVDRRYTRAQAKTQTRPRPEPEECIDVDMLSDSDSEVKPKVEDVKPKIEAPVHDVFVYDDDITIYKHLAPVRINNSIPDKGPKLEESEVKLEVKEEVLA